MDPSEKQDLFSVKTVSIGDWFPPIESFDKHPQNAFSFIQFNFAKTDPLIIKG